MQALAILESFDLRDGAQLARYIHTIAEALKLAFADRERYHGDAVAVPMAELLAPAYARERAALIRRDRAMASAPPPGIRLGAASRRRARALRRLEDAYALIAPERRETAVHACGHFDLYGDSIRAKNADFQAPRVSCTTSA